MWNMKVTVLPIAIGVLGTVTKGLVQGLGNKRTSGDHQKYSIKISQNTEESSGYLKILAVFQIPKKDHQLTLVIFSHLFQNLILNIK